MYMLCGIIIILLFEITEPVLMRDYIELSSTNYSFIVLHVNCKHMLKRGVYKLVFSRRQRMASPVQHRVWLQQCCSPVVQRV